MDTLRHLEEVNDLLKKLPLFIGLPSIASESFATYVIYSGTLQKNGQVIDEGEVLSKSIDFVYGPELTSFIEEARSAWDIKLADLLESNPIGEDSVPFFDTDHLSNVTKLGCNTFSNNAGLVRLSEEGIMHVVEMLNSISDNVNGVTQISIVVPSLEMLEDTSKIMKSFNILKQITKLVGGFKLKCYITFNPSLKNKKNWYIFDTSKECYGPRIVIQEPLAFKVAHAITEKGINTKLSYETKGFVQLGAARNVIRATHY